MSLDVWNRMIQYKDGVHYRIKLLAPFLLELENCKMYNVDKASFGWFRFPKDVVKLLYLNHSGQKLLKLRRQWKAKRSLGLVRSEL